MKIDLGVEIAGIKLQNPVLVASGTFGYGDEVSDLVPLEKLGGIITKTITLHPRPGNPPPRLAETSSGLLNTIGLQNVGVERFLEEKWPFLEALPVPVIVSIAGETAEEYVETARRLSTVKGITALELNLSCPNLKKRIVCQDRGLVREIIAGVVRVSRCPVIAKLSPQVTDIAALALAARDAGAGAVSLVNAFPGMAIDISTWKPKLSTVTGGLSGPAVKPLALRCVWEVYRSAPLPIIGGGGIMSAEDAVEFMLAGASAVSVGTANFIDPLSPVRVADGIRHYLSLRRIPAAKELVGKLVVE
ncbi:MAG: dihydroorotate dehydrogenase [Endomicrobiales bacterium]